MKTIKTPKGVHNRSYWGPWYEYYDKDERKARRKLFKAIRHKLLFNIPLTEEETEFQQKLGIHVNSKMDYQGRVKGTSETKRWVRLDGKVYRYQDTTRERIRQWKKRKKQSGL